MMRINKNLLLLCFLLASLGIHAQKIANDSIYSAYQQLTAKNASILKIAEWRAERKTSITQKLASLDPAVRKVMVEKGNRLLKQQWAVLLAYEFLEFTRTGNRANFERKYKTRRDMLKDLVIAETIEQKGRFMPMIVDGVWLICEESTWSLPATLDVDQEGFGLPEVHNPIVDLCVVQTSVLLSWTKFLLAAQLHTVNAKLVPRIDLEINKRALQPFLARNDLWWMGFTGRKPNNWNIYCNYYLLVTAAMAGDNSKVNAMVVDKSIKSAQYFLAAYPNDGGCDEGPSYWNMAGGTFGMFIQTLSAITAKQLDFSANEKIHNMGAYIHKVHIDSNYFVNFADASTLVAVDPAKVYAYGSLFKDEKLKSFAAYFFRQNWKKNSLQADEINVFFHNLEIKDLLIAQQANTPLPINSWLPDLQIFTARQQAGNAKGLFFAAKGGHNAESHNHNDVGNFVLYLDGKPVIIDVGIGTYTRDTFNENRWDIWNVSSLWHNCPVVNGVVQKNGAKFKAQDLSLKKLSSGDQFTLDIAGAYPSSAEVARWRRTFDLNRKNQTLSITENYQLKKALKKQQLSFISHLPVQEVAKGRLRFGDPQLKRAVELQFDPTQLTYSLEVKQQTDPKLIGLWGKEITRVILTTTKMVAQGDLNLQFSITR